MGTTKSWMLFRGLAACGLALMAGREFYKRSIVSLREQEQEVLRDIGDLPERVESAKGKLAEIHAQGRQEGAAANETELDGLPQGLMPTAVPALVSGHFAKFGLAAPTIVNTATAEAPGVPHYEISSWRLTVPVAKDVQNFASLLRAAEALGPGGSDIQVRDFVLWPDPEDSARQRATIRFDVLAKRTEAAR